MKTKISVVILLVGAVVIVSGCINQNPPEYTDCGTISIDETSVASNIENDPYLCFKNAVTKCSRAKITFNLKNTYDNTRIPITMTINGEEINKCLVYYKIENATTQANNLDMVCRFPQDVKINLPSSDTIEYCTGSLADYYVDNVDRKK